MATKKNKHGGAFIVARLQFLDTLVN